MQIGLRRISSDWVEWFKEACLGKGSGRPSRSAMASELCERKNRRGAGGGLCSASARMLLPKLVESTGVELPAPGSQPSGSHCRPEAGYPDKVLACGLVSLGEVSVDPVPEGKRQSWESRVESTIRRAGSSTGSARRGTGFSAARPSPPPAASRSLATTSSAGHRCPHGQRRAGGLQQPPPAASGGPRPRSGLAGAAAGGVDEAA